MIKNGERILRKLGIKISSISGDEARCNCPMHDDSNPSFSFNLKKGVWICYAGCGTGNLEQLTKRLNKKIKISKFEAEEDNIDILKNKIKDIVYESEKREMKSSGILKLDDFIQTLIPLKDIHKDTKIGTKILKYLKKRRISIDVLRKFNVMVALNGKYKDRLIFPIYNETGEMISFEARTFVDGAKKTLFPFRAKIRETLFNIEKAVRYNIKKVIVTEGIMDAIYLYQFINELKILPLASFGTNISSNQISLLMKMDKVYLFFDGDSAGIKSSFKIYNEFNNIVDMRIIFGDKDPDEYELSEIKFMIKNAVKNDLKTLIEIKKMKRRIDER